MEDRYIELLKWGRENPKGIDADSLSKKLKEFGFPSNKEGMEHLFSGFTRDIFYRNGANYVLAYQGYFQLLEHERLEEARKESKKAMKIAIVSMIITLLALLADIIIGLTK